MKRNQTTLATLTLLTLALVAPAQAESKEPPAATQPSTPAKTAEAPTSQPATQPAEKPKPKLNDAPPRKAVPVVIKEAKDVWKLLPEDLRPGKDGKVSDELAEKIKAWAKENNGKFDQKVQFVATETKAVDRGGYEGFWKKSDEKPVLKIKAQIVGAEEILKMRKVTSSQPDWTPKQREFMMTNTPVFEYLGLVNELKVSDQDGSLEFSLLVKDAQVTKIAYAPKPKRLH